MTTSDKTTTTETTTPKARELLRFRLAAEPMPLTRLQALLGVAAPGENATIRIYNGNAIIEEPHAEEGKDQ